MTLISPSTLVQLSGMHLDTSIILQVVGAFFGLTGTRLINRQDIRGYYLWLISNGALITLQLMIGFYVLALLHSAYFILSLQGIRDWTALAKARANDTK